jgi:UDP-N-acetylmuramate: L-alanyl-gamma-D-glutamyl-meso-diaminopimelate ligase
LPSEIPAPDRLRRVHLIAVAGTGMGSLACMLADRGFEVSGSDREAYPPMSDQLRAAGIEIDKGFAAEHVLSRRPDLVVIGNAVRSDNPEARAAIDGDLPYLSFSEAVRRLFLAGKHAVVVTGTHGKTTTTSLVGWILTHAGLDPSLLVGGVAENLGRSFRLGDGEHFVIEGDEYDTAFFDKTPKFLHYDARTLVFTSCEFDHADIYESLEQIEGAFGTLVRQIPSEGRIVAGVDAESVRRVLADASAPVEGYGFTEHALWRASDVSFDESGTRWTVWRGEERVARAEARLHGRHNVENALAAFAVAHGLGVAPEAIAAALAEFAGVRRRQQLRGEEAGFTVVDDFAHHPTAVRETIAAMRARFPDRRLWAVFEPRTNTSRRRFFESGYAEALAGADGVVLAGVYRADDVPQAERMRPERVVEALAGRGVDAVHLADVDAIIEHLVGRRSGRDLAVVMSNGDFGGIQERLLARLRKVSG